MRLAQRLPLYPALRFAFRRHPRQPAPGDRGEAGWRWLLHLCGSCDSWASRKHASGAGRSPRRPARPETLLGFGGDRRWPWPCSPRRCTGALAVAGLQRSFAAKWLTPAAAIGSDWGRTTPCVITSCGGSAGPRRANQPGRDLASLVWQHGAMALMLWPWPLLSLRRRGLGYPVA